MSTYLRDIAGVGLANAVRHITGAANATTAGGSFDYLKGDDQCCLIQSLSNVSGTSPSITGYMQESTDGNTWTTCGGPSTNSLPGTAVLAATTTNGLQMITFYRSARYLRHNMTNTGLTSGDVDCTVIEQLKQV